MRFDSKNLHTFLFVGAVLFFVVNIVPHDLHAQGGVTAGTSRDGSGVTTGAKDTFSLSNPLNVDSVGGLVQSVVTVFSYLAILVAVLLLVWVGFKFILARGDPGEMNKLKDWLMWIVVGVAVVIGARIIIQIVINTLSATGTVDERTIQSVQKAVDGR